MIGENNKMQCLITILSVASLIASSVAMNVGDDSSSGSHDVDRGENAPLIRSTTYPPLVPPSLVSLSFQTQLAAASSSSASRFSSSGKKVKQEYELKPLKKMKVHQFMTWLRNNVDPFERQLCEAEDLYLIKTLKDVVHSSIRFLQDERLKSKIKLYFEQKKHSYLRRCIDLFQYESLYIMGQMPKVTRNFATKLARAIQLESLHEHINYGRYADFVYHLRYTINKDIDKMRLVSSDKCSTFPGLCRPKKEEICSQAKLPLFIRANEKISIVMRYFHDEYIIAVSLDEIMNTMLKVHQLYLVCLNWRREIDPSFQVKLKV